ncbi:colicin immunity protein [Pseudomonas sp. SWRI51]|uniref:colicin immunity domain-containing protein n=1 Tax=Pseudomonas sp. SWRI51 TaxID=2745491 RepID=UPI001647956D|nr:colicin immunity domain-containing protein [Pseudomonas sp. SWRI51]MBC3414183.1 colicin immunity protein [Pseudomonas sp. SWRI51]
MSMVLIDLAKELVASNISGDQFTTDFFVQWRVEGKSGVLAQDDDAMGECLAIMFGLADSFVDGPKDFPSELTESELKQALSELLKQYGYM